MECASNARCAWFCLENFAGVDAACFTQTSIPWYLGLGNHDYLGNGTAQIVYSRRQDKDWRWVLPGHQWARTFTRDGVSVEVLQVDTDRLVEFHGITGEEKLRLRKEHKVCAQDVHDSARRRDLIPDVTPRKRITTRTETHRRSSVVIG